ncbi:MAG TPA: FAD/NAD(P)-binding protein [Verrucomicrobiae bacterium]|nr:FAD/NAD(P)-binding protein [Verrucomicrobiae bacterium]
MPKFAAIIAGGGASGALLAARLLRKSVDAHAVVVDPRERLGRGMAYSTSHQQHLLNVPAGRMSAFAEEPEHFVGFLRERFGDRYDAASFVPRPVYGDYLESIVREAREFAGERFQRERSTILAATVEESGVRAICEDGRVLYGNVLVVATGNASPASWFRATADIVSGERFCASAWDERALISADPDEEVLLLGTGLTAVDAVIGLRSNGHRGTIWMVSRRGLLPHEHRLFDAPPDTNPDATSMHDLLDAFRAVATRPRAWRAALDSLRPRTNHLWQALSVSDQRRFIRHVMPYWNVHRHRMAPEVAKTIADEISSGGLRMLAGRTGTIVQTDRGLRVPIRLRGEERTLDLEVGRVINCSGPAHDFRQLENPLIGNLLAQGIMEPLQSGIGVDIAPSGALRDRNGVDSSTVFAIGPVRYGTLIETTAMPEIRAQAEELASLLVSRFASTVSEMLQ